MAPDGRHPLASFTGGCVEPSTLPVGLVCYRLLRRGDELIRGDREAAGGGGAGSRPERLSRGRLDGPGGVARKPDARGRWPRRAQVRRTGREARGGGKRGEGRARGAGPRPRAEGGPRRSPGVPSTGICRRDTDFFRLSGALRPGGEAEGRRVTRFSASQIPAVCEVRPRGDRGGFEGACTAAGAGRGATPPRPSSVEGTSTWPKAGGLSAGLFEDLFSNQRPRRIIGPAAQKPTRREDPLGTGARWTFWGPSAAGKQARPSSWHSPDSGRTTLLRALGPRRSPRHRLQHSACCWRTEGAPGGGPQWQGGASPSLQAEL